MRDPQRINRITDALNHLWHMAPDQRLGQLIYNIVLAGKWDVMYQIEDDTWLQWIEATIEQKKDVSKQWSMTDEERETTLKCFMEYVKTVDRP